MLVPASATWRGTDGSTFSTVDAFRQYLSQHLFTEWRPQNICLHATAAPNLAQWNATTASTDPVADATQRMLNLTSYYRDEMHWSGGPHLFVTDRLICVFNPLSKRGTHSPSFNATHWGIECVGNFNLEPFDGPRRDLTIGVLAAMCEVRGLDPRAINLHRDDLFGHQDCPGRYVSRTDVRDRVVAAMNAVDTNGHQVELVPGPGSVSRLRLNPDYIDVLQYTLRNLGLDPGPQDGIPGPLTKAAVKQLYDLL